MKKRLFLILAFLLCRAAAAADNLYSSNPLETEKFRYVYGDFSSAKIGWKDFERFNDQLSLLTNNDFVSEKFPENIQFIGLGTGYVFGGFGFEVAYKHALNWANADNSFKGAKGYTRIFVNYAEATLSFPRADAGDEQRTISFFGSISVSANFFKWEIYNPNIRWRQNGGALPAPGGTANLYIDDTSGSVFYASAGGGTDSMAANATSVGFSPAVNIAVRFSDNFGMFGTLSTSYLAAVPLLSDAGYNIFIPDSLKDASSAAAVKSAKDLDADTPISALSIKFCYYF